MGNLVTERSRNEILPLGSQKSLPNGNLSMKRRSTKTMKKRELKSILQRLQRVHFRTNSCTSPNIHLPKNVSIQRPIRVNTKFLWRSQAEQYFLSSCLSCNNLDFMSKTT